MSGKHVLLPPRISTPDSDPGAFWTLHFPTLTSRIKPQSQKMKTPHDTRWDGNGPRPALLSRGRGPTLALAVALVLSGLCTAPAQLNPGIVDPTSSYAGKTYSQLAIGWWQYFMSLPTTNSPFYNFPGNPPVPLSTAQSAPVWFLCGNYLGGTFAFTNTIPSVALFLLLSGNEVDNAGCPTPNDYNEMYLRAWAGGVANGAISMTCTIDGVPMGYIDIHTTPYRVQPPPFSYTCPAAHSYIRDHRGLWCYENGSGIPYTIDGAISDGTYLLISPLSIGSHIITSSFQYSSGLSGDFTFYLTVQPATLNIALSQNRQLVVSWPQTPDSYTLESSFSLAPPRWQAVTNLSVSLADGICQATGPIAATNQFFRLRPN